MWRISLILLFFCKSFSVGELTLGDNNYEKEVNYRDTTINGKSKGDTEWKGLKDQKDFGIKNVENNEEKNEWEAVKDKSDFEYKVSIDYDKQTVGKEMRVNEEETTNEDNFVRPCAFDDWECIRKFFAHNSDCEPAYGPAPDPLKLVQNTIYFPFSNMTYTLIDLKVRGLSSSKIIELYYNKRTGDVVFAIQVRNLNETTPHGYFSFRRTAKESIVLKDSVTILFREVIFTAVIPKLPKLRLDLAEIHVDIREAVPVAFYGPKIYNSTDPTVIKSFASFLAFFPNIVREGTFFQAPLLTSMFIQSNVCDFGIELTSV